MPTADEDNQAGRDNWPNNLSIHNVTLVLDSNEQRRSIVKTTAGSNLPVPLNQLARFLNNHVTGAVNFFHAFVYEPSKEEELLKLFNEISPERLNHAVLCFDGLFRHFDWDSIQKFFRSGSVMRATSFDFTSLKLPSGVDADRLLTLPAINQSRVLYFFLHNAGSPFANEDYARPLFTGSALLNWLGRMDGRVLKLPSKYLRDLFVFVSLLKMDFKDSKRRAHYEVMINCPDAEVPATVRDETLFNSNGEQLTISIFVDFPACLVMSSAFKSVRVKRMPKP